MPQVRRPVTHRLLEEVQAEDEEHAEALLTLLINSSRFPAASDGAAPPAASQSASRIQALLTGRA